MPAEPFGVRCLLPTAILLLSPLRTEGEIVQWAASEVGTKKPTYIYI